MKQKIKNIKKLLLNCVMFPVFLSLVFGFGSIIYHEVAGIFFYLLLAKHIHWNQNFFMAMKKMRGRGSFRSMMAKLLVVGITVVGVSGILISRVVLPYEFPIHYYFLVQVHKYSSYFVMGNVVVHILDHIPFFRNCWNAICELRGSPRVWGIYGTFIGLALVVQLSYNEIFQYFSKDGVVGSIGPEVVEEEGSAEGATSQGGGKNKSAQYDVEPLPEQSLFEFLFSVTCLGCGKACTLMTPSCSVGKKYAEELEVRYTVFMADHNAEDQHDEVEVLEETESIEL